MIKDRVPCRKFYLGGAIMDKIYDKCCGIDVHKKLIVACFRCGRKQEVRVQIPHEWRSHSASSGVIIPQ